MHRLSPRHRTPRPVLLLLVLGVLFVSACNDDKKEGQPSGSFASPASQSSIGTAAPAVNANSDARTVLAREQRLLLRDDKGKEELVLRSPANTFPAFPVWSPDGTSIAFVQKTVFTGAPGQDWGDDIIVVQPGGEAKTLWKHDQTGAQAQGIAWTPDGSGILIGYLLTIIKDNKYQGQVQRLQRLDVASGKVTNLLDGAQMPSISADGTKMAYLTQDPATGEGGIWVSAADGSGAKRLVELGPQFLAMLYPTIAHDGTRIAFAGTPSQASVPNPAPRRAGGLPAAVRGLASLIVPQSATAHGLPMDVWTVSTSDGTLKQVTNFKEDEPYPAWSSDNKRLTVFATGGLYDVPSDGSSAPKKLGAGSFGGQVDVK